MIRSAFINAAGAANLNDRAFITFGGVPPDKLTGLGAKFVESYRAKYKKELASWGWVNRGAGIAHIPIDKAMEWVVREPPDIAGEGVPPGGPGVPSVPPTPPTPTPMIPGGAR